MDILNILLAPIRFLIGGAKVFVLALILIPMAIFYPVYLYLHNQPISFDQLTLSGVAILFVVTLVVAPIYTVFGGFTVFFVCGVISVCSWSFVKYIDSCSLASWNGFIAIFLIIGLLQRLILRPIFREIE
jgi:hypothetical protein